MLDKIMAKCEMLLTFLKTQQGLAYIPNTTQVTLNHVTAMQIANAYEFYARTLQQAKALIKSSTQATVNLVCCSWRSLQGRKPSR